MFERFLENRNSLIQGAAAELLNLLGLNEMEVTAYEEACLIEEAEKLVKEKNGLVCYPYYGGDDETPCYLSGDCARQQAGKCNFIIEKGCVFTFGTAEQFPYGEKEYVLVLAKDEFDAIAKYRAKYPDYTEGTVNCAFWYKAKEFFERDRSGMDCVDIIY